MKLARVDLYGSAWCPLDTSIAPPRVFGDVTRDSATVVAVRVGVEARQLAPDRNAWEVTADPDAITVPRLPNEELYALDRPSLLLRVASLHGTGRPWALEYAP